MKKRVKGYRRKDGKRVQGYQRKTATKSIAPVKMRRLRTDLNAFKRHGLQESNRPKWRFL